MQKVYLDNAATTQVRKEVIERMQEALAQQYGNPSSTHSFGRSAKTAVEQARKTIAKTLNAQPSEIIFTSGGTEADNMILRCAVRDLDVETIITSKIEHHAVLHTVEELEKEYGINVSYVDLDEFGSPDMEHLEELLKKDDTKKLVSLMHVNNEIGNITDINAVGELCKANNALFHSDTVQSIGHYSWDVQAVHVDFMTAGAHKFHGPNGAGLLYANSPLMPDPIVHGAPHENDRRAGTENLAGIIGLAEAIVRFFPNPVFPMETLAPFAGMLIEMVDTTVGATFLGTRDSANRLTNTVAFTVDGTDSIALLSGLDMEGLCASAGSACSSGSVTPSHVALAMGSPAAGANALVRLSMGRETTGTDITAACEIIPRVVERCRSANKMGITR